MVGKPLNVCVCLGLSGPQCQGGIALQAGGELTGPIACHLYRHLPSLPPPWQKENKKEVLGMQLADNTQEWADFWWQQAPASEPPCTRQRAVQAGGTCKSPATRMRCSPQQHRCKTLPVTSTRGPGGEGCTRELAEGFTLPCGHQNSAARCHLGEGQGKGASTSWLPLQEPASLVTAWGTRASRWHIYSQDLPGDLDPLSKILLSPHLAATNLRCSPGGTSLFTIDLRISKFSFCSGPEAPEVGLGWPA